MWHAFLALSADEVIQLFATADFLPSLRGVDSGGIALVLWLCETLVVYKEFVSKSVYERTAESHRFG